MHTHTYTEGRSILASPSATLNQRSEKACRSSTLQGLCASLLRAFLHARNLRLSQPAVETDNCHGQCCYPNTSCCNLLSGTQAARKRHAGSCKIMLLHSKCRCWCDAVILPCMRKAHAHVVVLPNCTHACCDVAKLHMHMLCCCQVARAHVVLLPTQN